MDDDTFEIDLSSVSSASNYVHTFGSADDMITFSVDDSITLSVTDPVERGSLRVDGDIKVGDRSLLEFMDKVEERLGIFTLNPELEDEVSELKELGKQYRELEEKIKSKKELLDTIKNSDMISCL